MSKTIENKNNDVKTLPRLIIVPRLVLKIEGIGMDFTGNLRLI